MVRQDEGAELVAVCDMHEGAAAEVARACGGKVVATWREVVEDAGIDIVVVATTHDGLAEISAAALRAGKHVLCEKPVGRCPAEVEEVVAAAAEVGCCFKAGYNHRFHPAIRRVHELCRQGHIGPLLSIRACYGHGGRPGYEREWRARADRAGGGEMLDQGVHLIDLCSWFLGEFDGVTGFVTTQFWDIAPLEDNAYAFLRTAAGQVACLHVSWTQWKNLFSFEVFGRDGYAIARGLGGSYGPEQATVGRRRPEGGTPEEQVFDFADEDRSWELEWRNFVEAIALKRSPMSDAAEALSAIKWVYRLYRASAEGRLVSVEEDPT